MLVNSLDLSWPQFPDLSYRLITLITYFGIVVNLLKGFVPWSSYNSEWCRVNTQWYDIILVNLHCLFLKILSCLCHLQRKWLRAKWDVIEVTSPSVGKAYMFKLSNRSSELNLVPQFPFKRTVLSVVAYLGFLETRKHPHLEMNMLRLREVSHLPKVIPTVRFTDKLCYAFDS